MVSRSHQMVSPVVRRILWKEYRSQSAVWLAIALELLLIQFWWATFGFQSLSVYGLFGATWVMSGVLALTTSALLFAAESEAGTDSLFRQWPVRVRDLLTGKLGYGVLSVAAMIVFGVLTTFFVVVTAGRLHLGPSDGHWSYVSIGHARSVVGLFAWGVFYSILTRNVLWTLALGALTEILVVGILGGMTGGRPSRDWMDSLGYVAIVAGVMAVDRRLLLRWTAFENDVPVITSMWTTGWRTTGWLHLLHFLRTVSGIIGRGTSSLIWIEIRRATPVLLGGWLGGWLVLAFLTRNLWSSVYVYGGWQARALELIGMWLAAVLCGLLTILPDRAGGTLLFLSQRGVSATGILTSKVAVWGVTFALMVMPSVLFGQYRWPDQIFTEWFGAQEFLTALIRQGEIPTVSRILSQTRGLCLTALLLGTFTAGVLAAEWIRRPILACLFAVPLAAVWWFWMSVIVGSWAPFGRFIVFPLVMIWVGIFWTGTTSILGHTTWRSRLGRAAWLPLIALITLNSFRNFRAHGIPPVGHLLSPEVLREPAHPRYGRARSDDLLTLGMDENDGPIQTFGLVQGKSMHLPGTGDDAEKSRVQFLDRLSESETAQQSLVQVQSYWNAIRYFRSAIRELRLADDACDLDASFEHLLKWLRLTEQMGNASRNMTGWVETTLTRRVIYAAIRRWAGHPNQTPERLRFAAEKFLAASGPECPVAVKPMAREYAAAQRIAGFRETAQSGFHDSDFGINLLRRMAIISGEHERSRRLVDYYYLLLDRDMPDQPATTGRELEFWAGSTVQVPWANRLATLPAVSPRRLIGGSFEITRSAGHATYLVLLLQAWQREHGKFPAHLSELSGDPRFRIHMATDPLAQQRFGYEPTGFSLDLQTSPVLLVSASQPILYSLGLSEPRGLRETRRQPSATEADLIIQARNWDGGNWEGEHRRFIEQPSPQVYQMANPSSIRFVIFGQTIFEDSLADSPAEDQAESSVSE